MPTYKSPKGLTKVQERTGENGVQEITAEFDIAAAVADGGGGGTAFVVNDIIEMVKMPKGAKVKDVLLTTDDLDTSTGIVLEVGIGGDTDKFITGSTIGRTGGIERLNNRDGFNYEFTENDTIDIKVQTAATGTAATTGKLKLNVFYSMNS